MCVCVCVCVCVSVSVSYILLVTYMLYNSGFGASSARPLGVLSITQQYVCSVTYSVTRTIISLPFVSRTGEPSLKLQN